MSDTGYESVAEADYVQLDDAAWQETVAAWEGVKQHAKDIGGVARKAHAMCASIERRSGQRRAAE